MAELDITDNYNGTYEVKSPSGNTYAVKRCKESDGGPDNNAPWECNCPAGTYRGICKHITAVKVCCGEGDKA